MARIVRFHQTGGPEVLKIEQVEREAAGAGRGADRREGLGAESGRVDVSLGAVFGRADCCPRDSVTRRRARSTRSAPGVTGFKVGDAVSTIPAFSQNQYGVYGDTATVPAFAVAKHPASLSWVDAAAIWMQYATAYGALVEVAGLKAGETLLIPAASSSVGIAAIQIAKMVGATPVALTRSSKKSKCIAGARRGPRDRDRRAGPGGRGE